MSESEKAAKKVSLKGTIEKDASENNISLAQKAFKRRRITESSESKYLDVRHIFPTSNICERTFSVANNVLGERRRAILPVNFEMQMSLKFNSSLWSFEDIDKIVNRVARS